MFYCFFKTSSGSYEKISSFFFLSQFKKITYMHTQKVSHHLCIWKRNNFLAFKLHSRFLQHYSCEISFFMPFRCLLTGPLIKVHPVPPQEPSLPPSLTSPAPSPGSLGHLPAYFPPQQCPCQTHYWLLFQGFILLTVSLPSESKCYSCPQGLEQSDWM